MICALLVLVLVVILGFCLAPRAVRSTPPSPGAVELYMIEYASGIQIAGAQITFPTDYGTVKYNNDTYEEKELYDMRVRILQEGDAAGALEELSSNVVTSPSQLPSGNFEPIDIEPTEWYKRSEQGKKALLTLSTPPNYTNGKKIYLEIGFRNSDQADYTTRTSDPYGPLTPTLSSTTPIVLSDPTITDGTVTYK